MLTLMVEISFDKWAVLSILHDNIYKVLFFTPFFFFFKISFWFVFPSFFKV